MCPTFDVTLPEIVYEIRSFSGCILRLERHFVCEQMTESQTFIEFWKFFPKEHTRDRKFMYIIYNVIVIIIIIIIIITACIILSM